MCRQDIEAAQVRLFKPRSDGRTQAPVDPCIAPIVQALNDGGFQTTSSCCGHGHRPGTISLEGGMELLLMNAEQSRELDPLWPDIQGNKITRQRHNMKKVAKFHLGEHSEVSGQDQRILLELDDGSHVVLPILKFAQLVERFKKSEVTRDLGNILECALSS